MSNEVPPARIKAFVGRSFLEADEIVWYEVRKILESLRPIGLTFEDAKEAQLRPVSEKVRQGIERNDFYIGILTRRLPLPEQPVELSLLKRIGIAFSRPTEPSRWTTSNWIIQESGFAIGKGKRTLLLIEKAVDFPSADLDGDTEWVPFDRTIVSQCSNRLVAMITDMISQNLPTVQESVQVLPPKEAEAPEEQQVDPSERGDFSRVIELLDEGQFQKADEEFETFIGSGKMTPWWHYFYLRLKAVRGHAASLQELKKVVLGEPQNVDARSEFAAYYRHFEEHKQAAQILLNEIETIPEELQPKLLRLAADELAKDKQYDAGLKIVRDLILDLKDISELRLTYLSLADIAKLQSDRELESAALEHVLDLDPSDSESRFRIAYLYGQMENHRLAAYHYKLRLDQGREATALNNVGVAYDALKLPGKGIDAFTRASGDSWLAKANLSHAYIDRGFLAEAEKLASEVTRADCDETARNRAIGALRRISSTRSKEQETEEKVLADAKNERGFRSAYVQAFVGPSGTTINGLFEIPHGTLSFKQAGSQLLGEGKVEERTLTGLIVPLLTEPSSHIKVRNVKFKADIIERSGRFKIETDETQKQTLLSSLVSPAAHGLLILAADGESFEVLEEEEKRVKIWTARKAQ